MNTVADELRKLSELREAGSLTADEYLEAKALVLSRRPAGRNDDWMRDPVDQPSPAKSGVATAALWLGVASIPLAWVGIVPIVAFLFSLFAAFAVDANRHRNAWMAAAGMGLSLLGLLAMLSHYRHI